MIYIQMCIPTIWIYTLTCIYNKQILCVCVYTERERYILHISIEMHINVSNLTLGGGMRIANMRLDHSDLFERYKLCPYEMTFTGNSTVTFWFCNLKWAKNYISLQNLKFFSGNRLLSYSRVSKSKTKLHEIWL